MTSLFPDLKKHPYYIATPNYTHTSAGVRCLHLLCHWLNRNGERAFVFAYGGGGEQTNQDFLTPLLTQKIVETHAHQGVNPIVVYPEVVSGNPLNAQCVVRYVLNFPGLLGGDKVYAETELVFGFSKTLAKACGAHTPVLHMPIIDQTIFKPGQPKPRSGAAYYAYKYRDLLHQEVFGLPEGAIEITKGRPDSPTPEQVAEILRSVELFYCFENTALSIEATLCGCPSVVMPNPYLETSIALDELNWEGHALGDSPAEIERARQSVDKAPTTYQRLIDDFFGQLQQFVALTQEKASRKPGEQKSSVARAA